MVNLTRQFHVFVSLSYLGQGPKISEAIYYVIIFFFRFVGILSTMGYACFGRHFWFTPCTRPAGNHSRTSVLLFDRLTSTCNWKELVEDSKMGVSLLLLVP